VSALGPLLKLTALPIVAYSVMVGWRLRGWRAGALIATCSLVVFPLQWLRGWAWGGTLEANSSFGNLGSVTEILGGLGHSVGTFLKTAIWLGGWSFFRPPIWLLMVGPLLGTFLMVLCIRRRSHARHLEAHIVGLVVATLGFVTFALGQHQVFGVWGGAGGWYAWGWAPWLALLTTDLFEVRPKRERALLGGAIALAALAHIVWFEVALRFYR
jgi:hypothetical protein